MACAVNQLEDEARSWWEIVASYEDVQTMTLVHFLNLFQGKYLSEANLSNKVREFMTLSQGSMSVAGMQNSRRKDPRLERQIEG